MACPAWETLQKCLPALVTSLCFLNKKSKKSDVVEIRSKGGLRTGNKDPEARYRSVPPFERNDVPVLLTNVPGFPFLFRVVVVSFRTEGKVPGYKELNQEGAWPAEQTVRG